MSVKKAVDISYHNGIINFERLKNAVDYVIIRCGYGQDMTSQDDKQWNRNVGECERLGIPYGVYFYSYAKTKANIEGEINHCLRLLKGHTPTLPVFFDSEEKGTQYVAKHNAKRFCDAMLTNGYKAGIYAEYARDVIRPTAQECTRNPRARSTKMRWAVKADHLLQ